MAEVKAAAADLAADLAAYKAAAKAAADAAAAKAAADLAAVKSAADAAATASAKAIADLKAAFDASAAAAAADKAAAAEAAKAAAANSVTIGNTGIKGRIVRINLADKYSMFEAVVELAVVKNGKTTYVKLGTIDMDDEGIGMLRIPFTAPVLIEAGQKVRVKIGNRVIVTSKAAL